jgi:hypothetical protein
LAHHRPFQVIGFHSCDKDVGLTVINGQAQLKPSNNPWDWLGEGIYFWEQNPDRALQYAVEAAIKKQVYAGNIKTPFVIGAIIELGNCLNLIVPESVDAVKEAYSGLEKIYTEAGKKMPDNKDANRKLDCAVFIHESGKDKPNLKYDTISCAFVEGDPIYPGANFTTRLHIEICVLNSDLITGYFLPRPIEKFNPYLHNEFIPVN